MSKLVLTGNGMIAGGVRVLLDDPDVGERVELRTVTRIEINPDGAHLEVFIPELDVEVAIPDAMANALLDIERLRVKLTSAEAMIGDLQRAIAIHLEVREKLARRVDELERAAP